MKLKRLAQCCLFVVALAAPLQAKEMILDAAPFEGKKVRLDGLLKEWPKPVVLSEAISGTSGQDPQAMGVVAYDTEHLYVGMRITDSKLTRTGALGNNEDYASLKIAFPRKGGGHKTYQVRLYPGVPGKSAGAVKLPGLGKVPGAKIIEAPSDGGLSFEASIPWRVFPEAKRVRSGLRGALLYHDSDGGSVSAVIGTSNKSGGALPMITIEGEYALNNALVFPKGLNPKPEHEVFGNLVGDQMFERVAVYDRYLTVTGWGYREGKEFFYQDLNLLSPRDLKKVAMADFDGDGKDELFIHRRVGSAGKARIYAEVWKFDSGTSPPRPIFQHEVGMVDGQASIVNEVALSRSSGEAAIVVSQGSHDKVDPGEWSVPVAGEGTHPTLMPWEAVASRRWEWNGDAFEMVKEKAGRAKLKAPTRGTRVFSGVRASGEMLFGGEAPPPAPRPPSAEEMMDKVYGLYRADRGMRQGKPTFDFVTNVAGDATPERVLVHGSDLVVFGQRFKEGNSYVYTSIGVKDPKDILDVTARDMTGDGHADVIVRALLRAQASKAMGGKVVTRHALFVYKVQQHAITRIFAAETGRSLDEHMVLANVRFTPVGRAMWIDLLPGHAVGWNEKSYPFPEDTTPYGGLEPMILPWSDTEPRRYSYQGSEYKVR
jgi:hypothetical protein